MGKMAEHCVIRNGNLFCTNCGSEFVISYPIDPRMFEGISKAFRDVHKNCKKKWQQPVVNQSLTEKEKADWWLMFGERGVSSETIFQTIDGRKILKHEGNHPMDPDDFRRCYLLLQTVPEWRNKLHFMKVVSPIWRELVDNWDLLTEMLEEQLTTGNANGMYQKMKSLGA
jgi:hypothetical protein